MSIVNDVLRNLDNRNPSKPALDFSTLDNPVSHSMISGLPWFLVLVASLVATALAIKLWVWETEPALIVPDDIYVDLFQDSYELGNERHLIEKSTLSSEKPTVATQVMISKPETTISPVQGKTAEKQTVKIDTDQKTKSADSFENSDKTRLDKPARPTDSKRAFASDVKTQPAGVRYPIVEKTAQTQASEMATRAMQSGDTDSAKNILPNALPGVQKQVQLRLLIQESPEKVLPFLKQQFTQFEQQPALLAIAAQAEQRAGRHSTAIQYYRSLSIKDANNPKWQVGLAISLDAVGKKLNAWKLYRQALNSKKLPVSLHQFASQRIKQIQR